LRLSSLRRANSKSDTRMQADSSRARTKIPSWALFLIGLALVVYTPYGFVFLFVSSTNLGFIYYPIADLLSFFLGSNISDLIKVETSFVPLALIYFIFGLLVR